MKRSVRLLCCCLALLYTLPLCAQADAQNRSLLWRISGNGLAKPSYLFGTIHLICPADYLWTPAMQRSLQQSERVCFEMDMDAPGLQMEVAMGMMNTNGQTLKDFFADSQYHIVEQFVKDSLQMDIALFQPFSPMALQSIFAIKTVQCAEPASYESNIMDLAQKQDKEIIGLESVGEQLDLFHNLPTDTVVQNLVYMASHYAEERAKYQQLIGYYKRQNLPALHGIIQRSGAIDADISAFVDDRNKKWITRMTDEMEQSSIFFAVGAGHLLGENGIINLLRQQGYTVTAVK